MDSASFSDFDPKKIYQWLVTLGDDYADALEAYEMLDETEKSALAQMMTKHQGVSNAAAETLALASDEYRQRVEQKVRLKNTMLRAKVRYESAKKSVDLLQTKQANLRAEMTLVGKT